MTDEQRQAVLDRRRDQLETDIKSALNFLHGTDLVIRLMQAADNYAAKCCEAAADDERQLSKRAQDQAVTDALAAERARLREPVTTLTAWLEHLPQRHIPLRAAEALQRLRNLTAPCDTP